MPRHTRLAARLICLFVALGLGAAATGQPVQVGQGSYRTGIPPGEVGPQRFDGAVAVPKVSAGFDQPIQTNDFWSSLIYPFFGDPFSNILYAHPVNAKATASGMEIGYTSEPIFVAADYLFPFRPQLTVGVDGMAPTRAVTDAYGDWTVTALWEGGPTSLSATLGHGLPYVFFEMGGGDARISVASTPTVWYDQDGVLGLTVGGQHYGIFGPSGSVWTGTTTLRSPLAGQGFLSVAVLPDASTTTLDLFRRHAYAFVTDSRVEWTYDEGSAQLTSTYAYTTEAKQTGGDLSGETLSALYRHQWRHSTEAQTGHTYASPRGEMRLVAGNTFTTDLTVNGVLPTLPDRGDYNRADLLALVQDVAAEPLAPGPSYENGKAMGRMARVVHIADQLGATAERDGLLAKLKTRLEDWLTSGGAQQYAYNASWDVLTGYPSGFGADNQINDHHFHASYAIMSAATIAQFDPAWAAPEAWGGMIDLLIRDANSWDRDDDLFPFLRTFDAYAGHSWAAGHGDFAEGNNQESSSESMHFATATILWGAATGRDEIRDLGIFLHATEASAVHEYWFDVEDEVFPEAYPRIALGIVWGGKGVYSTWFGAEPEFIHGINMLPIASGSLYLGWYPDYVSANYDAVVAERGGLPAIWKDVMWQYLALGDPSRAISEYLADPNYEPFDGESRAHTLHWLFNLKKMGHVATDITADVPTHAVFRDGAGDLTYVAYNARGQERIVTFSDGYTLSVPARSVASATTSTADPNAPVVLIQSDRQSGKAPLAVTFDGTSSFDPQGGALTYRWASGEGETSDEPQPSFTFEEVGDYWVVLEVETQGGLVSRDSVEIRALPRGTPFGGSAVVVPGIIEAENYDVGGEGIAYHDAEPQNIGQAYRPDEGVDIEGASTNGFDVYWITAGEWLEYTIEASATGAFTITPYMTSVPGFGKFRVLIDNEPVSDWISVPGAPGWQLWRPFEIRDVQMSAGEHLMRFEFDSDSDPNGWLLSMNWIEVGQMPVASGPSLEAPTRFEILSAAPNPFSETTTVTYSLPTADRVTVEVVNALGRRVQVASGERRAAGVHTVEIDGRALPSGVYVVRVSTSGGAVAQR
ncbi:MAG: glycosyl hydrolase, partial [Bacteroidota bacterium]